MRSRFCAFALRDVDYLLRTLHSEHEDGSQPEELARANLEATCRAHRFVRLRVLGHEPPNTQGASHVHFEADIFRKGRDVGFAEVSEFRVEGGQLRYVGGRFVERGTRGDLLSSVRGSSGGRGRP